MKDPLDFDEDDDTLPAKRSQQFDSLSGGSTTLQSSRAGRTRTSRLRASHTLISSQSGSTLGANAKNSLGSNKTTENRRENHRKISRQRLLNLSDCGDEASTTASWTRAKKRIKGLGTTVHAVQDSGSFQILYDEAIYLCENNMIDDLTELFSIVENRKILLFTPARIKVICSVLKVLARTPDCGILLHFLSLDASTGSKYSAAPTPQAAFALRNQILQDRGAVRNIINKVVLQEGRILIRGKRIPEGALSDRVSFSTSPTQTIRCATGQSSSQLPACQTPESTRMKQSFPSNHAFVQGYSKGTERFTASCAVSNHLSVVHGSSPSTLQDMSAPSSTPESNSSWGSADPTAVGRRRRKRRPVPLVCIAENSEQTIDLSFPSSTDSASLPLNDRLRERIAESLPEGCPTNCLCIPQYALNGWARIVTGKFQESDTSCFETIEIDDENENPLLVTNKWLADANIMPSLSTILTECLEALRLEPVCLHCLGQRISTTISLIDGAALLHQENRIALSSESLITVATKTLELVLTRLSKSEFADVGMHVLKMLTSLTHENPVIVEVLDVSLMAEYLIACVNIRTGSKTIYDSIIFCLNSLANYLESGGDWNALSCHGETDFWRWIVQWLVSETSSFQDALLSQESERHLQEDEDERLVTAGNGFVLVACVLLLCKGQHSSILSVLPGESKLDKISFMSNTLKAFCNFYHFSVGELSVAVVAPVRRLVRNLEELNV